MKAFALAAALLASATGQAQVDPFEGACNLASGTPVYVDVTGLKDRTGRLKVEVYPANEADFLKDDTLLRNEGKPFRRVWGALPASGPVSICVKVPSPGRWAVLVTHDRDGRNKFNFWQDGAGLPGSSRLGRNRPKLNHALLNVGPRGGMVKIRLQYLKGLGGFGPLSK